MEKTQLLYQIFGVVMAVAGFGILLNLKICKKMAKEFSKSPGLSFLAGFMALMLGTLLIFIHNTWDKNIAIPITIICWLTFLKGVLFVVFPRLLDKMIKHYMKSDTCCLFSAFIMFVVGLVFLYIGFVVSL